MKLKRPDLPGRLKMRNLSLLLVALFLTACTTLKKCAYEGVNRDEWQKPDLVIRSLNIRAGDRVADIGSGGGYFTFRLARAVEPAGKVYAVDIDEELNRYVKTRAKEEGYTNVEVILAMPEDPLLPQSGVDLIFFCNTYHHLENRVDYFARVKKYLRPGGRVAIIEFSGRSWLHSFGHSTSRDVIQEEMKKAGYELQNEFDYLPRQYFLVFSQSMR